MGLCGKTENKSLNSGSVARVWGKKSELRSQNNKGLNTHLSVLLMLKEKPVWPRQLSTEPLKWPLHKKPLIMHTKKISWKQKIVSCTWKKQQQKTENVSGGHYSVSLSFRKKSCRKNILRKQMDRTSFFPPCNVLFCSVVLCAHHLILWCSLA